jgi:C-8 sterol isomerase
MAPSITKVERNIFVSNAWAVFVGLLGIVLYGGIGWDHQYVFTPAGMKEVAVRAIAEARAHSSTGASNSTAVLEYVVEGLRAKYGDYIFEKPAWMFNNAGGAMGAMLVRWASIFLQH